MVNALQDAGADARLYEWTSPENCLRNRVEQALWRRPSTLLTVAAAHVDPRVNQTNAPRILRGGKVISLYNPARLVLPVPIEPIPAAQWEPLFGFASPFGDSTAASPGELIERVLVLTALRPQPPSLGLSRETQVLIGQALLAQQRFEEGLAWLQPLLHTSSPPRRVRAAVAYAYARTQQWRECVELSREALDQNDGHTAPFYSLGLGLNGLGQYADALGPFHRALSTHSHLAGAWVGRGRALLHLDRVEEALSACERGLAATKHSWNAWAYENPVVAVEAEHLLAQVRQRLTAPPPSSI